MKIENGLTIVYTGNGKGKTTAALGLVLRALGAGLRVKVIQFIKGCSCYSELKALSVFSRELLSVEQCGEGFTRRGDKRDRMDHILAANIAVDKAEKIIETKEYDMVVLDELNYAVDFGLVKIDRVLELVKAKGPDMHLVITGRNAKEKLIEMADLVTEMREIKHPYHNGVKAQKGIEY